MKKGQWIALGVFLLLIALFFVFDLHKIITLENFQAQREVVLDFYADNRLLTICLFMLVYISVTGLSLPGSSIMTLIAGAIFGFSVALVLVSFASTIGASIAFVFARYLFRDLVQRRFESALKPINEGVEKEGAFYLFALRLVPAVPFFAINVGMALTPIRLWTFYWVSQIGMLAGTAVYINAGHQLGQIESLGGIVSPMLIGSLVLLGLFPLIAKKVAELDERLESSTALSVILDKRLWRIFLLGVSSGLPWLIIGSGMSAWLTDEGLSRSGVGLFGVIFVAYTVNFLWAPVVDHLRLPVLGALGQRRSWILLCQALLVLLILFLSLNEPSSGLWLTAAVALAVASVSATQDLSIDAYRITVIRRDEPHLVGLAAAFATSGWWTGASLPGVAAFWLADDLGWPLVYQGLAVFMLALTLLALFLIREPERQAAPRASNMAAWFDSSYIDAVGEFFRRNGMKMAFTLLGFIFLFKIGEAFLGRMAIVFYNEVGFTNEEIGTYSKLVGWWVTIICSLLAGFISLRYGVIRVLFAAGIAMAAANLLFSWIAVAGADTRLFALAVVVDGVTGAFSTVAFVAFISEYTSRLHSATQYAALASLGNLSRTLLAATSGILVTQLGGNWALFFIITALMVAPSLLLLAWIASRFRMSP